MNFRIAAIGCATLALLTASATATRAAWTIVTIDPTANSGWSLSMRIGALPGVVDDWTGVPHVSYWTPLQGNRYYDGAVVSSAEPTFSAAGKPAAAPASSELIMVPVTALALDNGGEPWILQARLDGNNGNQGPLWAVHRVAGTWTPEAVGTTVATPSIDVDLNTGIVHVFYLSPNGPVYAWRDGGGWHAQPVDSAMVAARMRLDRHGRPCVVYVSPGSLQVWFTAYDGSAWHYQRVEAAAANGMPALAFCDTGEPRLAYSTGSPPSGTGHAIYARQTLGTWTTEEVTAIAATGAVSALAVGGGDVPCIAYVDATAQNLHAASRASGAWVSETVDATAGHGGEAEMAYDGSNEPVIVYRTTSGPGVLAATGSALVSVSPAAAPPQLAIALAGANPVRAGAAFRLELRAPDAGTAVVQAFDAAGRAVGEARTVTLHAGANAVPWPAPRRAGLLFVRASSGSGAMASTRVLVLD